MPLAVRQSVLGVIIGTFLIGNVLLAAALWHASGLEVLFLAADGPLVAQPMLLAIWLGLARQPIGRRLATTLGLSLIGTLAFLAGVAWSDGHFQWELCLLFLVTGVGATVLVGGFFRAHRFLVGVLTAEAEPGPAESGASHAQFSEAQFSDAQFSDAQFSDAQSGELASRELQFGIGYVLAMTGAIALLMTLLRWLTTFGHVNWSTVFLFGWTFLVYSMLAALVTVGSVLAARRQIFYGLVATAYTLLAPLLALLVVARWDRRVLGSEQFINLYAYAFGLAATLALVASILRRLGYRLRGGWL